MYHSPVWEEHAKAFFAYCFPLVIRVIIVGRGDFTRTVHTLDKKKQGTEAIFRLPFFFPTVNHTRTRTDDNKETNRIQILLSGPLPSPKVKAYAANDGRQHLSPVIVLVVTGRAVHPDAVRWAWEYNDP